MKRRFQCPFVSSAPHRTQFEPDQAPNSFGSAAVSTSPVTFQPNADLKCSHRSSEAPLVRQFALQTRNGDGLQGVGGWIPNRRSEGGRQTPTGGVAGDLSAEIFQIAEQVQHSHLIPATLGAGLVTR